MTNMNDNNNNYIKYHNNYVKCFENRISSSLFKFISLISWTRYTIVSIRTGWKNYWSYTKSIGADVTNNSDIIHHTVIQTVSENNTIQYNPTTHERCNSHLISGMKQCTSVCLYYLQLLYSSKPKFFPAFLLWMTVTWQGCTMLMLCYNIITTKTLK